MQAKKPAVSQVASKEQHPILSTHDGSPPHWPVRMVVQVFACAGQRATGAVGDSNGASFWWFFFFFLLPFLASAAKGPIRASRPAAPSVVNVFRRVVAPAAL